MREAARAPPDVVLTDLHMPEMNGVELCVQLRAIDGEVAVILMTASADMETVVAGMRAGADDYLSKPLHYDALLLSLDRAIARREAKRDHERTLRALNAELMLSSIREQELGEAEARQRGQLNALLANLSEGVVIADAQGRIVMFNDVARTIFGLEGQLVTVTALDALEVLDLGGRQIACDRRPLARALAGEEFSSDENVCLLANGDRRRVVSTGTSVNSPRGDVELAIVVFRDVTALRHLEQQRDEYVSLISHDLRGPLSSVLLSLALLKETGPSNLALLERAERNVDRMTAMLDELSAASSLEAGAAPKRAPCDMGSIVAGALDSLDQPRARRVTVETDASEPFSVFGDVAQLERVVGNLLTNALKYSVDGAPVSVRLTHVASDVLLEVTDQGIGIAPESTKQLFERYFRTTGGKTKASGLGLGLYIARLMIEANGGRITVESELGKGSCFRVVMPNHAAAA
jgi:two-component system, NtrC family, sensor histidine kinase KinB